jgi:hypothetical protein
MVDPDLLRGLLDHRSYRPVAQGLSVQLRDRPLADGFSGFPPHSRASGVPVLGVVPSPAPASANLQAEYPYVAGWERQPASVPRASHGRERKSTPLRVGSRGESIPQSDPYSPRSISSPIPSLTAVASSCLSRGSARWSGGGLAEQGWISSMFHRLPCRVLRSYAVGIHIRVPFWTEVISTARFAVALRAISRRDCGLSRSVRSIAQGRACIRGHAIRPVVCMAQPVCS